MDWGDELWDQYSQLEKHTEKGIEFLDKYCHFVKERQRIELEYASSLKRLIRNYQPKKKETDDVTFSTITAFKNILTELQGMANQHDLIADGLSNKVTKEVQIVIQDLKQERKKLLQEARVKEASKDKSIKKMDQAKDTYRQAHNAFIAAKQQFHKVDNDLSQSRAQVGKSKNNMMQKDQHREDCKNEYILQFTQTNKDQHDHYYNQLPGVFKKIQELDERRISKTSDFYKEFSDCHRSVLPIINKCLDCITEQADSINPAEDSRKVTVKYKSGLTPPQDFEMLNLDESPKQEQDSGEADVAPSNSDISAVVNSSGGKNSGTITGRKKKGFISLFTKDDDGVGGGSIRRLKIPHTPSFRRKPEPTENWSHLPPHQQQRELQKKIDELQAQVNQELKSKEALLKMREVYTKNPTLGDPATVEGQLTDIGKKVDTLRLELQKYQKFMGYSPYSNNSLPSNSTFKANAEGKTSTPQGTPQGTPQTTPHSTPVADRVGHTKPQASTPHLAPEAAAEDYQPGSNQSSPARDIPPQNDTTDQALSPGDSVTRQESFYEDVDDEFEDHQQAKAKFPFHSEDENSLSMEVDDVLDIMEEDTGDGWTRVRKGNSEGFVPTSYLELEFGS